MHNSLLRDGVAFSPLSGGGVVGIFGACRRNFNSSNSRHILVGCPNNSHKAQGGGTLNEEVLKDSTFFPFGLSFLLASNGVDAGIVHFGVVFLRRGYKNDSCQDDT